MMELKSCHMLQRIRNSNNLDNYMTQLAKVDVVPMNMQNQISAKAQGAAA